MFAEHFAYNVPWTFVSRLLRLTMACERVSSFAGFQCLSHSAHIARTLVIEDHQVVLDIAVVYRDHYMIGSIS